MPFDAVAALKGEKERELSEGAERREAALRCIEKENYRELMDLGFGEFFERLAQQYPPAKGGKARRVAAAEMRAFVRMLWRYPPDRWLRALDIWEGGPDAGHRPYPAQLKGLLDQQERGVTANERYGPDVDHGRVRKDQEPAALDAVLAEMDAGEAACECNPAPMEFTRDPHGVLRCAGSGSPRTWDVSGNPVLDGDAHGCRGLEQGQVNQALERREYLRRTR